MPWSEITFSAPGGALTLHDALTACRDTAAAELADSATRLSGINGAATVATNPAVTAAATASDSREALAALTQGEGACICVHPYVHPLGDLRGDYALLTPQQAAGAMAAKLADAIDPLPDGELTGVFLLLRGADHASFASALAAFNAVFPVTELRLAQRRAERLATLETDKLVIPLAPPRLLWQEDAPRKHSTGRALDAALGGLIAVAEGYDRENTRPDAALAALIEAKSRHMAELETAWTELAATLQGGAGQGMVLTGNADSLYRQFSAAAPAVEGYKLAALCGWIGDTAAVTLYREVLGG